ncbi:hypothetical protein ACIQ9R_35960 [Streptomyces sp. NPDC094447]|uniref:hypothetical protein n=1 Tax=Streptomyces sp. NPDC094447 TaxID=3366062 RepID=UPI003825C553
MRKDPLTSPRPTDLSLLAPYGWDAADPTWGERYAAPDQPGPVERGEADVLGGITVRSGWRAVVTDPLWRCPSCGRENNRTVSEGALGRGPDGAPAVPDAPVIAWLVTMSDCGHTFRASPAGVAVPTDDAPVEDLR